MPQRFRNAWRRVWTTVRAVWPWLPLPPLVVAPIVGVAVFLWWVILPVLEEAPAATTAAYVLEEIPRQENFYYFVAALVGLVLGWRAFTYVRLRATGSEADDGGILERVSRQLRRRAVVLRMRADLTLIGAFLLLIAGVYFNIFVLREISGTDASRIAQAQIASEFGTRLRCIAEGRCMFEIVENVSQLAQHANALKPQPLEAEARDTLTGWALTPDNSEFGYKLGPPLVLGEGLDSIGFSANGQSGIIVGNRGSVWVMTAGRAAWNQVTSGLNPSEKFHVHALSADGEAGIVTGNQGSVWAASDGLMKWRAVDPSWKERESTSVARLNGDAKTGFVVGSRGSLRVSRDGLSSWRSVRLPQELEEPVNAADLGTAGRIGIVASLMGVVVVSKNGLNTWTPLELSWGPREGPRIATLSEDGNAGIVASDERMFVSSDGLVNWYAVRPDWPVGEWIDVAMVSAEGDAGIAIGSNGSMLVSNDNLENWSLAASSWPAGEWVKAAALSRNGNFGIVAGNQGSLFVSADHLTRWAPVELVPGEKVVAVSFRRVKPRAWTVQTDLEVYFGPGDRPERHAIEWKPGERVAAAVGSARSEAGIVAGTEGSVLVKRRDEAILELVKLQWRDGESPAAGGAQSRRTSRHDDWGQGLRVRDGRRPSDLEAGDIVTDRAGSCGRN